MLNCRKCGIELTDENGFPSRFTQHNHICKDCDAKLSREWYKRNPEKYVASYTKANNKRRMRALEKLAKARGLNALICERCGCPDVRVLTPNHLNGAPKDINRSGRNLWIRIIRMDDETIRKEFSLLCHPCNWICFYEEKFRIKWIITWQPQ